MKRITVTAANKPRFEQYTRNSKQVVISEIVNFMYTYYCPHEAS